MKMFFLLKNNARRGMGGKGVLKRGEEKEAEKGRGKRSAQKGPEKGLQNSRILKRMAGWGGNSQILKAGELCLKTSGLSPDALIMSINRNNREWSLKIHIFYFHNPSCRCNAPTRCSPPESRHGAEDCKPKSGRILSA